MTNNIIDILDDFKFKKSNLEKLYYVCCMNGGYESYDPIIHIISKKLLSIKKIDLDLIYYYKYEVDIDDKINKTNKNFKFYKDSEKKIYAYFIDKLDNKYDYDEAYFIKKIEKHNKNLDINDIYKNTLSLRGYNQIINQNLVYGGNFYRNGPVKNYNINNIDIDYIKNLLDTEKDIFNKIFLMFQSPLISRLFTRYYPIRESVIADNNYNIEGVNKLLDRNKKIINNLITSLYYIGDCREHSLIYLLILSIIEYEKFMKLLLANKIDKLKEIILNQYRIIDIDVFLNSHFSKNSVNNKYIINHEELKENDSLNNYEKKKLEFINNKRFMFIENHSLVMNHNYTENKYIFKDLLYKKEDIKFNEVYSPDYVLDNSEFEIYNDFGLAKDNNIYNPNINQVFKFNKSIFLDGIYLTDKNINKTTFLNNNFNIKKIIFEDINRFVINRENYFNKLIQKTFDKYVKKNKNIHNLIWLINMKKSSVYDENDKNSTNIHYFLTENAR